MSVPLESIPESIIDFAAIADITGSDTFAIDLMDTFLADITKTKQEYAVAIAKEDIKQLRAICHRLGGATAYFVTPQINEKLSVFHGLLHSEPENKKAWLTAYEELISAIDNLCNLCRG